MLVTFSNQEFCLIQGERYFLSGTGLIYLYFQRNILCVSITPPGLLIPLFLASVYFYMYIYTYFAVTDLQLATKLHICQGKDKEFYFKVGNKQNSLDFRM